MVTRTITVSVIIAKFIARWNFRVLSPIGASSKNSSNAGIVLRARMTRRPRRIRRIRNPRANRAAQTPGMLLASTSIRGRQLRRSIRNQGVRT